MLNLVYHKLFYPCQYRFIWFGTYYFIKVNSILIGLLIRCPAGPWVNFNYNLWEILKNNHNIRLVMPPSVKKTRGMYYCLKNIWYVCRLIVSLKRLEMPALDKRSPINTTNPQHAQQEEDEEEENSLFNREYLRVYRFRTPALRLRRVAGKEATHYNVIAL